MANDDNQDKPSTNGNGFDEQTTSRIIPSLRELHHIKILSEDCGVGKLEDRINFFSHPEVNKIDVLVFGNLELESSVKEALRHKCISCKGRNYEVIVNPASGILSDLIRKGYAPELAIVDPAYLRADRTYNEEALFRLLQRKKTLNLVIVNDSMQGFEYEGRGLAMETLNRRDVREGMKVKLQKLVARRVDDLLSTVTKELTMIDGLTSLYNRKYGTKAIEKEVTHVVSQGGRFSFFFFDIDNFKRFNDTYGHDAGDEVLKTVGRTMIEKFREGDIVARFGGEEFMVLMPHTDYDSAFRPCARFMETLLLRPYVPISGEKVPITVSASIVEYGFPEPPEADHPWVARIGYGEILKAADIGMYIVKRTGKNRILSKNVLAVFIQNDFCWDATVKALCSEYNLSYDQYKSTAKAR
jgi:diguanylate cyclase (GGDEF)-like protein